MTCGLRRSDYWPNREYGRRTFVRRCDLDAHYGACHAELRCATCGAATTRAGRHKCAAPWLEDYDVACPAVWKSNLQPDFNVRVFESFDTSTSAVLRELDESDRSVQESAESTSI